MERIGAHRRSACAGSAARGQVLAIRHAAGSGAAAPGFVLPPPAALPPPQHPKVQTIIGGLGGGSGGTGFNSGRAASLRDGVFISLRPRAWGGSARLAGGVTGRVAKVDAA